MNKNNKMIGVVILILGIMMVFFSGYKLFVSNDSKSNNDSNEIESIEESNNTQNTETNKEDNTNKENTQTNDNTQSKLELKTFGDLQYYLYIPKNATNGMPLIMYLHGATFKNLDISELLKKDGFPKYVNDEIYGDLRSYVVIPKIDSNTKNWVDISDKLSELIKSLNTNYGIDLNKVSLTGHSIGGTGTYQLQIKLPTTFACIAPMSGFIKNSDENINAVSKTKIWAFVGTNDAVISPNSTKQAIKLLKDKGANAKLTEYQDADHFSVPVMGYKDNELIKWFVNCSK